MTLTEFLLARIAEDGQWADAHHELCSTGYYRLATCDCPSRRRAAECEAKRDVLRFAETVQDDMEHLAPSAVSVVALERFARILAVVYADHPDYQQEWTP